MEITKYTVCLALIGLTSACSEQALASRGGNVGGAPVEMGGSRGARGGVANAGAGGVAEGAGGTDVLGEGGTLPGTAGVEGTTGSVGVSGAAGSLLGPGGTQATGGVLGASEGGSLPGMGGGVEAFGGVGASGAGGSLLGAGGGVQAAGGLNSSGEGGSRAGSGSASDSAGGVDGASGAAGSSYSLTDRVYSVDDASIFANPERGFYHHEETHAESHAPLDAEALAEYRSVEAISLILRLYYLEPYRGGDITASYLSLIEADFAAIRAAGLKAILRFAYTDSMSAPYGDADREHVIAHIGQLAPIMRQNSDVIISVQAGFIGAWGEWYYTDHFGDGGQVSSTQWDDRKAVVDALLSALPAEIGIQLRTPAFKQRLFGSEPLSENQAHTGESVARVGHHNDCFLSGDDDQGTYGNVVADKAYLEAENLYVIQGGETCAVSSYSGFDHAAEEMEALHYTYLNVDYNQGVLDSWGANIDVPRRLLGYRLSLLSGSFAPSAERGGSISLSLELQNSGYAPPMGYRKLEVLLENRATGALYRGQLAADPRRFTPGSVHTISSHLCVPDTMPGGTYALLLSLPDPSPSLHDLPRYSIRLANVGLWGASTGYHDLQHQVLISETTAASSCDSDGVLLVAVDG